ncbi:unnamed protein product, partial [Discosporangium mesarthrocarpum]
GVAASTRHGGEGVVLPRLPAGQGTHEVPLSPLESYLLRGGEFPRGGIDQGGDGSKRDPWGMEGQQRLFAAFLVFSGVPAPAMLERVLRAGPRALVDLRLRDAPAVLRAMPHLAPESVLKIIQCVAGVREQEVMGRSVSMGRGGDG